jgi:hypothetical protein
MGIYLRTYRYAIGRWENKGNQALGSRGKNE